MLVNREKGWRVKKKKSQKELKIAAEEILNQQNVNIPPGAAGTFIDASDGIHTTPGTAWPGVGCPATE